MTDTSRGESWLNNYDRPTREDAESLLVMKGENPNSSFWSQALNNIYQEETDVERETDIELLEDKEQAQELIDRQQYEERERIDSEESQTENRVSKFIRGILRGLLGNE